MFTWGSAMDCLQCMQNLRCYPFLLLITNFKYLTLRLENALFFSGHRAYLDYMNYSYTLSDHSGRKFWK